MFVTKLKLNCLYPRCARRRRPLRQGGLSLIELLIAMALFSFIAIGIVPMLVSSLASNNRGWEATQAANFAKSYLDPMLQAPYEAPGLTVPSGSTELLATSSYSAGQLAVVGDPDERWHDGAPTDQGQLTWTRNTRVRYLRTDDLPHWPGGTAVQTPLDGAVDVSDVEYKEIQVQLVSVRQAGMLGAGQRVTFQVFKSY